MLALYDDPHFKVKLSEAEALHQRKQDAFKWIQVARQTLQKDISELLRPEFEVRVSLIRQPGIFFLATHASP